VIFSLFLVLTATATPVDEAAHSLADYSECLRVNSGRPDPAAAPERARLAIAACRAQREASTQSAVEALATPATAATLRRRIEQAVSDLEALFPAVLAAGGGVEIPRPIAPQVRRYLDCLVDRINTPGALQAGDLAAYRISVDAAIAACATVRTAALAEAERALAASSDFTEPDRRHEAITRAFDQTDALQRNLPQIMDAVLHAQVSNAAH